MSKGGRICANLTVTQDDFDHIAACLVITRRYTNCGRFCAEENEPSKPF